jgi:hypothetical protein
MYLRRLYWHWGERPDGFIMGVVSLDDPLNPTAFHTLEVPGSPTSEANQTRPILPGTYWLKRHVSDRPAMNGKPKLYGGNLSESRAILMHGGENSESSTGCILFGRPGGWGRLMHSNHVWYAILKPWLDACHWHAKIHIGH